MNEVRRIQRRPRTEALATDVVQVEKEREYLVDAEDLHALIEDLGPPESDIIRMKLDGGLRFSDIAEQLQIPANTVKTQYYRGIRWMQDRICARLREDAS